MSAEKWMDNNRIVCISLSLMINGRNASSKRTFVPACLLAATIVFSYATIAIPIPFAHALSENNLYVSSGITNEVKKYDAGTGNFTDTFIAAGSTGLVNPVYLAFGPDGNLYVTSEFSKNVQRYNGTTGAFIDVFVPAGSSGLNDLLGITFGPDGNLYAVNFSSNEVKRYNGNTGAFMDNFVQDRNNNNGMLSNPVTVTFGPDGNLYIGGTHDNVKRYNGTTGLFIDDFIPEGSTGLGTTSSLTFGQDGNLYIASFASPSEIKRFNGTTGAFIDNFVAASDNGGLILPQALTFGLDGNLYVVSGVPSQEVMRYNGTTGAFMDKFVVASDNGGLSGSSGLTFGPDGNLYVTSTGTNEVKSYNGTTGVFVDNFVRAGDAGLRSPTDLLFGPDGNLYVNNVGREEVKRYNGTTGAFINNIGGAGNRGDMAVGPDGSLYVTGRFRPTSIFPEIDRYNSTTGAFIGEFASQGRLDLPFSLAFGPDGNLYVSSVGSGIIERYNGTTGVFIDNFVAVGNSARLQGATEFTFGPDGNLYAIAADVVPGSPPQVTSQEIKRYNGVTGAFMDIFIPEGAGGLGTPFDLAFGPDGNLYIIDGTNDVKRYNGTTGAFIDILVPAVSVGPGGASGLAFPVAQAPPETQKHTLTLNAGDLAGKPISGIWTVIRLASDGSIIKTGFTPLAFVGDSGASYNVSVANYDGKIFQRWDDKSTSNIRTLTLSKDVTVTATYDTGDSLRGFTSLTHTGTEEQPDLTVNAVAAGSNNTLHMWTVIDPQTSNAAGSTTYKVYAGNYQNIVFDHWNDGNADRIRTLTIDKTTTMIAYYRTEP